MQRLGIAKQAGVGCGFAFDGVQWLLDAPNILAVPNTLLGAPVGRLGPDEQLQVERALDFMLRAC